MDWNVLFKSPGYALVTNQILEVLNHDSIMACRKVSPIWKEYIDKQRFWRVRHLSSLMDKFADTFGKSEETFCEQFPEWEEVIPYIKTEMNVSDMDKLIDAELYANADVDDEDWDHEDERDQARDWCPLHWAVHKGNFEFVEVMIRTPFNFNDLQFTFEVNPKEKERAGCERCEWIREERSIHYMPDWSDEGYECVHNNSVLHKAARNGDIEIVKLILKFAEEKKININAKNEAGFGGQSAIVTAKDEPEVVKLLLKHCKYDRFDLGKLGLNTLACMAESFIAKDEPPKKKMKNSKK